MYMIINKETEKVEQSFNANGAVNAIEITVTLVGADWRKTHTLVTTGGLNG